MVEKFGLEFADDDPEYLADPAADVDLDLAELRPTDPKDVPKDEGDAGHADPHDDTG